MRVRRLGASLVLSGVAALAISVASAGVGTSVALADPSCQQRHICFWGGTDYQGYKVSRGSNYCGEYWCRITTAEDFAFHSLKNRFGNRKVLVTNIDYGIVDCVGPNGERSSPSRWDVRFHIGQLGSRCP
jgi:hypothetical protein